MMALMSFCAVLFVLLAARWVVLNHGWSGLVQLKGLYIPGEFGVKPLLLGAAIASLSYIGFDAISTLSEEAHNPRRNILLASVLTCLITGALAGSQVYAGQLIWPSDHNLAV